MAPLVQLSGITRHYGTVAPVVALDGVDLEVESGECVAVVGASGSGKTTLLNVIGCLDRQTSGSYLLGGVDVDRLTEGQRADLRARHIGFIFQSFHLLAYRSVLENVMLAEVYGGGRGRADRRARALRALAAVGLIEHHDRLPTRLSGGERQRVAIARALVTEPELLLCDEPTGNLDSRNTAAILELLGRLHADGRTILVITHDPDVVQWTDRQVRIADGRLRGAA